MLSVRVSFRLVKTIFFIDLMSPKTELDIGVQYELYGLFIRLVSGFAGIGFIGWKALTI